MIWLFLSNLGRRLEEWASRQMEKRGEQYILDHIKQAYSAPLLILEAREK